MLAELSSTEQPDLIPNAVEEIIRLTTQVRHFMRTAQQDTEICGQPIAKGDWMYLSYKAANLDPKVFPRSAAVRCHPCQRLEAPRVRLRGLPIRYRLRD